MYYCYNCNVLISRAWEEWFELSICGEVKKSDQATAFNTSDIQKEEQQK